MSPVINPKASKLIDAYIAKQPAFAKPMLVLLRKLIHQADPDITEDWKWGPNFNHGGLVVNIGGFKEWVALVFFNGAKIKDTKKLFNSGLTASRTRVTKFYSPKEIQRHQKDIVAYIKMAVANNVAGVPMAAPRKRAAQPMPPDIKKSLTQRSLSKAYAARPPYQQRDYISWITSAKQESTRAKRLEMMLEDLADGNRYMGMPDTSRA